MELKEVTSMQKAKENIHTYTEELWKGRKGRFQSRKQFDTLMEVRTRYWQMVLYRKVSCWWDAPDTEVDYDVASNMILNGVGSGRTGSNWQSRWNMDYKLYSMWREYTEGRSNVKSPITFAPVEALMSEFQENNSGIIFTAQDDDDDIKVKIFQQNFLHVENIGNFAAAKVTTMKETAITGTSIAYNGWINKERDVDIILNDPQIQDYIKEIEDGNDSDKKAELDKKLEKKQAITKNERIVEYNNFAYLHVPLNEFFIDPSARCLRGFSHEATDCIWRTKPTLDQVRAEFLDSVDPFVIQENVRKVKAAYVSFNSYDGSVLPFFKMPGDIPLFSDKVELVKYYNKQTDKYIVIANDVVIRDGPLPYNHKELPFSRHVFLELPGQFYGMGYGAMLESLQSEDETLRNLAIETMKINLSLPIFINTDVFEDVDSNWDRLEPGQKVEVGGSVGRDSIRPMDPVELPQDYYAMRNSLKQDATATSGIVDQNMPQQNVAVRNNLLSNESSSKMFRKLIKNWGEGYRETARQYVAIVRQQYPNQYDTEENEDGDEVKTYPSIRTKGFQVEEGDNGDLTQKSINGYGKVELKPKYLDLSNDPIIETNLDDMIPVSSSVRMQRSEQMVTILVPILSNPQIRNAPGIQELVEELVTTHGANPKITEQLNDESSPEEEAWAEQENTVMGMGKQVPGIPGRSPAHNMIHAKYLLKLYALTENPTATMQIQDMKTAQTVITNLAQHLVLDMTPKEEIGETALKQAGQFLNKMNPQPQMAMPPTPQPMMGAQQPQQVPQPQGVPQQQMQQTPQQQSSMTPLSPMTQQMSQMQ